MKDYHCTYLDELREPKIFGINIFDICTVFIASVLVNLYLYWRGRKGRRAIQVNFNLVTIICSNLLFIFIGVILHHYFEIPTMLNYYLGLNSYDAVVASRHNCTALPTGMEEL